MRSGLDWYVTSRPPWTELDVRLQPADNATMNTVSNLDEILATLRAQLTRGGLTYQRAVDVEYLISTFERMRATRIADDLESGQSDTPALPQIRFHCLRRERTT